MSTRASIQEKYGIVRLLDPEIANQELSPEEAEFYEKFIQMSVQSFEKNWNDDDSGEIE